MTVYYCKPMRRKRYAQAFNGLGDVAGLKRGDTLVLGGLHDRGYQDNLLKITVPGVNVIGDPDEPFRLIACAARLSEPSIWEGPDDFGAYRYLYPGSTGRILMQGERVLCKKDTPPDEGWHDGCFHQSGSGGMLFVRPYNGSMEAVFYTDSPFGIKIHAPEVAVSDLEVMLSARPFEFVNAHRGSAHRLRAGYANQGFHIVGTNGAVFSDLEARHCAVGGYLNSGAGNRRISSGCVFSWIKVRNNDQGDYFRYSDNHGWGVQGGNYNLFEGFDIDGCAGSGFTTYQFRGQQMCHNIYRDFTIRNIRNLDATRRRNERGFEFGSDSHVEPELHTGNEAYDISIDTAKIGVRLKSRHSDRGRDWVCDRFDIRNCEIGLLVGGGKKHSAGIRFTNSTFTNCSINIDHLSAFMPHSVFSGNTFRGRGRFRKGGFVGGPELIQDN